MSESETHGEAGGGGGCRFRRPRRNRKLSVTRPQVGIKSDTGGTRRCPVEGRRRQYGDVTVA
eukprot:scaffold12722_cov118-Isochrysis_galbana.AAC.1